MLMRSLAILFIVLMAVPCSKTYPALGLSNNAVHRPVPYSLANGRNATVPFRLLNGNIILAARIDDGMEADYVFDTGLPASGIFLFAGSHPAVSGLSTEQKYCRTFSLPGVTFKNVRLRRTGIQLGMDAVGIIGPDLLGSCIVEIDFIESVIRLHEPELWKPEEQAQELPLYFIDRSPFIEVDVSLDGVNELSTICVVDLGSAGYLQLQSTDKNELAPVGRSVSGYIGTGIEGKMYGQWGRAPSVRLGRWQLTDVLCAFSFEKPHPGLEDRIFGNLGNGVLSKFNIVFDYRNRRAYFEPNAVFDVPTSFPWPSGMILRETVSGEMEVMEVFTNTSAAQFGIRVSDVITTVSGIPVDSESQAEMRRHISQSDGFVELGIRRGKQTLNIVIEATSPVPSTVPSKD
ncbi:MAG: PDZ domain-containing protein [bacterium]|nr:PDZ domain-containing protein [bacterium]